jgi:electron transfer flavoprotein alpha subunit
MTTLVLIQYDEGRPVNGALAALTAAQPLGDIVVLACGSGAALAANELALMPQVISVLTLDTNESLRAETMAPLVIQQQQSLQCTHIVAAANSWTRGVLPRVAALLDVMAVTEVIKILDDKTCQRAVHAGAAIMTLRSDQPVQILTIRSSAFAAPKPRDSAAAAIEAISLESSQTRSSSLLERTQPQQDGAVELLGARVVVSGGRGTGSVEGYERLRPLANLLGAALGASRAAVDAGFAPADQQVGQTGKSVAPDLYIAMGISGAVQHLAGMKDSKVIVAINKDPEAPIFEFADYGLVADLLEVLPQLQSAIAALPPRE